MSFGKDCEPLWATNLECCTTYCFFSFHLRSTGQYRKCNNYITYITLYHPFSLSCWIHSLHPQSPYQVFNLKPAVSKLLNLPPPKKKTYIYIKTHQPWLSFGATSNSMGSATSVIKLKTGSFRDTLTCHVRKTPQNNGSFGQCAILLMSRNFRIFLWVSFRSCHHTVISCPPKGWLSKLCCAQKDLFWSKISWISVFISTISTAYLHGLNRQEPAHVNTSKPLFRPWKTHGKPPGLETNPPHLDLNPSPLKCWHLLVVGFSPSKTVCQQGGGLKSPSSSPKILLISMV